MISLKMCEQFMGEGQIQGKPGEIQGKKFSRSAGHCTVYLGSFVLSLRPSQTSICSPQFQVPRTLIAQLVSQDQLLPKRLAREKRITGADGQRGAEVSDSVLGAAAGPQEGGAWGAGLAPAPQVQSWGLGVLPWASLAPS